MRRAARADARGYKVDFGVEMAGGGRRLVDFASLGACRRGVWRLVSFSHWFCARAGEIREGLAPVGTDREREIERGAGGTEGRRVGRLGVHFTFPALIYGLVWA